MTGLLLFNIIGFVEGALTVLIIARIAVSWIGLSPWHPIVRWLRIIVDPILAPFRRRRSVRGSHGCRTRLRV